MFRDVETVVPAIHRQQIVARFVQNTARVHARDPETTFGRSPDARRPAPAPAVASVSTLSTVAEAAPDRPAADAPAGAAAVARYFELSMIIERAKADRDFPRANPCGPGHVPSCRLSLGR